MSGWVKLPEEWWSDPATEALPDGVLLFHQSALGYSCRYLTDGFIPFTALRHLWPVPDPMDAIRQLIDAQWWEEIDGGWVICAWKKYLLPKTTVERRQAQSAESSKRFRDCKDGDHSGCRSCWWVRTNGPVTARVTASLDTSVTGPGPDPSRAGPEARARGGDRDMGLLPAAAEQTSKRPVPHVFDPAANNGDGCCPLPENNPTHTDAA